MCCLWNFSLSHAPSSAHVASRVPGGGFSSTRETPKPFVCLDVRVVAPSCGPCVRASRCEGKQLPKSVSSFRTKAIAIPHARLCRWQSCHYQNCHAPTAATAETKLYSRLVVVTLPRYRTGLCADLLYLDGRSPSLKVAGILRCAAESSHVRIAPSAAGCLFRIDNLALSNGQRRGVPFCAGHSDAERPVGQERAGRSAIEERQTLACGAGGNGRDKIVLTVVW